MSNSVSVATGIDAIGEIRWGAHICLLYESDQDLIDALVSYFKKGLERNALCLWLSPVPLTHQVIEALRERIPHFDQYQQKEQIEAIAHSEWYLRDGQLSASAAMEHATAALNRAAVQGFDGVWVAGDLSWGAKKEWPALVVWEETVCTSISELPAVALCAHRLHDLGLFEALDLFRVHRSVIMKREGRWEIVENLEQMRMEEALREAEGGYKHLLNSTLDGVEIIDGETGRIVVANKAAADIFGFASPEEMIGIDPLTYIPAEDKELIAQMVAESMFEKDLHRVMELRALRTDGGSVWISAIGVRTQYQGKLAGLISIKDITEQRKAEKALQESQRDLQAIFDGVHDGIAVFDVMGRLVAVNKRILDVGGYFEAEIVGKRFDQLTMFNAESLAKIPPILAAVLAGEEATSPEMEVVTKSGQELTLDVRITPLKKGNDVLGCIVVMRDVTKRKEAEAALRESEEQLQQSFRKLEKTLDGTIQAMQVMVGARDPYTSGHQRRVMELSCAIGEAIGLPSQQMQALYIAGLLHDLGKILLPTEILTKPGRLNEIEVAMIRTHPRVAYDILKSIEFTWPIAQMVLQHHERMDGSGYPDGLRGDDILLEARILAVADVVEAMSSHRPYRSALGIDKALEEIAQKAGVLYDPVVVDACLRVFRVEGFAFKSEAMLPKD